MDVDNLVASLSTDFSVSEIQPGVYDPVRPHPRFSHLYKANSLTTGNSQEKRRRELLERQKSKRFDVLSRARNLSPSLNDPADDTTDSNESQTSIVMDEDMHQQRCRSQNRHPKNNFKDKLMLSEWLVDVPEDMSTGWYLVPCPQGRRCLIVASNGWTRCYSKTGYERNRFCSLLPGGSKRFKKGHTWLDCIYSEIDSTFYVLDIMMWQDVLMYDGEQKFAETVELMLSSKTNRYSFVVLPQYQCTIETMESAMKENFPFELDGLLFYCKEARYSAGLTPLVGWLKPFMMPEILNVKVPKKYENESNVSAAQFMEDFNIKEDLKKAKRRGETNEKNAAADMSMDLLSSEVVVENPL